MYFKCSINFIRGLEIQAHQSEPHIQRNGLLSTLSTSDGNVRSATHLCVVGDMAVPLLPMLLPFWTLYCFMFSPLRNSSCSISTRLICRTCAR